jgi:hypothetical protein
MKKLVVLFLILGLVVSNLNADVLCVKKKVTIVNGKANLGKSVKRVTGDSCPSNSNLLMNLGNLADESTEFPEVAPSKLMTGAFGTGGTASGIGDYIATSISLPFNCSGQLTAQIVEFGGSPTTECPGTYDLPEALPGYLCVYVSFADNVNLHRSWDPLTSTDGTASKFGTSLYAYSIAAGRYYSWGTWAARCSAS